MNVIGIDRTPERTIAALVHFGAQATLTRAAYGTSIDEALKRLGASRREEIAVAFPPEAYSTHMKRVPAAVSASHERGLIEQDTLDYPFPKKPRQVHVLRPTATTLYGILANADSTASIVKELPDAILVPAFIAWHELAPDAILDARHPHLLFLSLQTPHRVPLLYRFTNDDSSASAIASAIGSARSMYGSQVATTVTVTGAHPALEPIGEALAKIAVNVNRLEVLSHSDPPWALAYATAVAGARTL